MYRANAKEVLRDREHYADAVSEEAATTIADALNYWETLSAPIDDETYQLPLDHERHSIRQESDEFACSCGRRWDVSEGDEHP